MRNSLLRKQNKKQKNTFGALVQIKDMEKIM